MGDRQRCRAVEGAGAGGAPTAACGRRWAPTPTTWAGSPRVAPTGRRDAAMRAAGAPSSSAGGRPVQVSLLPLPSQARRPVTSLAWPGSSLPGLLGPVVAGASAACRRSLPSQDAVAQVRASSFAASLVAAAAGARAAWEASGVTVDRRGTDVPAFADQLDHGRAGRRCRRCREASDLPARAACCWLPALAAPRAMREATHPAGAGGGPRRSGRRPARPCAAPAAGRCGGPRPGGRGGRGAA